MEELIRKYKNPGMCGRCSGQGYHYDFGTAATCECDGGREVMPENEIRELVAFLVNERDSLRSEIEKLSNRS